MKFIDHDEVVRLTKAGWSASRIAELVGCSERQVQRIRSARGVTQPVPEYAGKPITPERLEAVGRMVADGASHKEIRRTLGVTLPTIERHFPGTAWTPEESGRLSRQMWKYRDFWREAS